MVDFGNYETTNKFEEEEEGIFEGLVKAPFRGVAGAAAGVANLFGADVQDNFGLGKSQGTAAGFVEGFTQFLVGFIPASKALSAVKFLKAAETAGKFEKATKVFGKGAAAGALADFTVFDGNDERISNLIQSVPGLANPVTEFLASDPEDSEVAGRFKNAIEGLGLGIATEAVFRMFGKMRNYNKAVKEGDTETAKKLSDEIGDDADEAMGGSQDYAEPDYGAPREDLEPEVMPQEPVAPKAQQDPVEAAVEDPKKMASAPESPQEPPAPRATEETPATPKSTQEPQPLVDDREVITEEAVRQRIGVESEGEVILVPTDPDASGVIRGLTQYGQYLREPNARLRILQLKPDAKIVALGSRKAKEILGDPKSYGPDKASRIKGQIDAARQKGLDAVRINRGADAEVIVLNPDAVAREVNVRSEESFWQTQEASLKNENIKSEIVNLSRVESYLRNMGLTRQQMENVLPYVLEMQMGDRKAIEKVKGALNFSKAENPDSGALFQFINENYSVHPENKKVVTWDEDAEAATEWLKKATKGDDRTLSVGLQLDADDMTGMRRKVIAARIYMESKAERIFALGKAVEDADAGLAALPDIKVGGKPMTRDDIMEMMAQEMQELALIQNSMGAMRAEAGRMLNMYRANTKRLLGPEARAALDARGGVDQVMKNYKKLQEAVGKMGLADGLGHIKELTRGQRIVNGIVDVYYFNLLSAPRTLMTNLMGSFMTGIYRPFEAWLGSKWGGAVAKDPAMAQRLKNHAEDNLRMVGIIRRAVMEIAQVASGKLGLEEASTPWLADAAKNSKTAWDSQAGVLTGQAGWLDGQKPVQNLSAENLDLDPLSPVGRSINWVGKQLKLPGRLMGLSDEGVKQVVYHSYIESRLAGQFLAKNPGATADAVEEFVRKEIKSFTINGQAFTEEALRREAERQIPAAHMADEGNRQAQIDAYVARRLEDGEVTGRSALAQEALDAAEEATFTKRLNPEDPRFLPKLGNALQKLADAHPMLKFFIPFIRTPLNILAFAADRSLIPGLNKDLIPAIQHVVNTRLLGKAADGRNRWVQQIMSGDPKVVADAYGRMGTAMGITATFGSLAASGHITGRGPDDPERRRALEQAGWQPYSIKVGDTYVSYQRGDPFASIIAFFADWSDAVTYSDDDPTLGNFAYQGLFSIVTNLESKSYLAGITDLMKILEPGGFERVVGRMAGTLAIPNVLASARGFTDTTTPEVAGILDRIWSRVPLLSGAMEPQRNVLGEPVNKKAFSEGLQRAEGAFSYLMPVTLNVTSSDIVSQELANLLYPVSLPRPEKYGLDLRDVKNDTGQSAYDRWMELTGEVKLGGRKLRPALERLIQSREYQKIPDAALDSVDLDNPKVGMIRNMVGQYRREAERQMLKEYPELRELVKSRTQAKDLLRSGQNIDQLLEGLK